MSYDNEFGIFNLQFNFSCTVFFFLGFVLLFASICELEENLMRFVKPKKKEFNESVYFGLGNTKGQTNEYVNNRL